MNSRTYLQTVPRLAGACCLALGAVNARADWATLTWQANDGRGWTSGRLETTSSSVQVRLFAAWEAPTALGFAHTSFDGIATTDHIAADAASDFSWPWHLHAGRLPPLVMRFGNVLKFDDREDTLPPGQGPHWLTVGQLPRSFGGIFITDNPVSALAFDLTMDDVPGSRLVDMIFRPATALVRLYTDEFGAVTTPPTEVFPLEIVYIPSPGSALAFVLAGLLSRRRRA